MNIFDAVILGIVEGLTEFLPVSSTGHLILVSNLLHLPETEFLKTFQVAIQLGAILAVVALYWRKLFLDFEIIKRVSVALLPALGVGFLFYASIRKLLESSLTVVVALFIGGIILILFEFFRKEKEGTITEVRTLSYKNSFLIGLFQALAVIPGVSRAGATILGGLLLGLKRTAIVEFSFLLAVPTVLAATVLDLFNNAPSFSLADTEIFLVGFATSFVVALLAIRFFLRFVESHTFVPFGVYRIVVALLFFFLVL